MRRAHLTADHELFRTSVEMFVEREVVPFAAEWDAAGIVPHDLFARAGAAGFLGMAVPEGFGGGGVDDFRYNQVLAEVFAHAGLGAVGLGFALHNDICLPYLLSLTTDEQRRRWLPGVCSGELVTAIAMTEPGIGSDLASMTTSAIRDGDHYIVNGAKTFITNGINADLVITAVKTDPSERHRGMSLVVVERGMDGFERGRNLEKIGMHAQDTAELFFTDVHVPVENLLGTEGGGFGHLVTNLPQERLSIAIQGVAAADAALGWTLEYTEQRSAFGQPVSSFQNSRFALAEMRTEIDIAQVFVDHCVMLLNAGELTAEEAAEAKWWCTELQKRTVDRCLQLHGGYGYMLEYPIARAYLDARVTTIYGGTTEIMKEIIGRSMVAKQKGEPMFSALVVDQTDDGIRAEVRDADERELPEGDVTVDVEWSTVNYKDALAIVRGKPVVRSFPLAPGIDFAGTVAQSTSPEWKPGDAVLCCGWGLGEERWGGLAQRARVDGAWLTALPDEWSTRDAMVAGTAGFTASLAAGVLERSVATPGPVLVTGAKGGVGTFAVLLLAAAGYDVIAATTTPDASGYLRELGAGEIVDTAELSTDIRPLGKQRWAGAVDNVGGDVLAGVISCTTAGGVVAAVGNAGGMELHTTVAPFILRGVTLAGVNSVYVPAETRVEAWRRIADRVPRERLAGVVEEIGLTEVVPMAARVLDNRVTGRVVVDVRR